MAHVDKGELLISLKKRITKLDLEIDELKAEQRRQSTNMNDMLEERKRLQAQMETLTPKGLVVSDHAIIRYVERVLGINIDNIRQAIANEQLKAVVATLGDVKAPIGDGAYAVIKNHTVVTVTTNELDNAKTKAKKAAPRLRFSEDGDDIEAEG